MVPRRRSVLLHSARPRRWAPPRPSTRPGGFSGARSRLGCPDLNLPQVQVHTPPAHPQPSQLPLPASLSKRAIRMKLGQKFWSKQMFPNSFKGLNHNLLKKKKGNKYFGQETNILVPNCTHQQPFCLVWKNCQLGLVGCGSALPAPHLVPSSP